MVGMLAVPGLASSGFAQEAPPLPVIMSDGTVGQTANENKDLFGWDFSGALTLGSRFYLKKDPLPDWAYDLIPDLNGDVAFPYIAGDLKLTHTSSNGRTRFTVEANGNYDFINDRGDWDIPEANIFYDGGSWSVLAGIHKESWGVAESVHLVDILNPIDLTGDPFENDRKGQPMVNANFTTGIGTISLYGLFGFRQVDFDGVSDRLPVGEIINNDAAVFEDGTNRNLGFAARYSNTINMSKSSLDYAFSYFLGTARSPRLVPGFDLGSDPPVFLAPYYDHIQQVGSELLYAHGALQLKFEGIYRRQRDQDIWAGVGGFEYTFANAFNSKADVGIIGEYSLDSRDDGWLDCGWDTSFLMKEAAFAGLRIGLNNARNTSLLAGASFDVNNSSRFYVVDFSTLVTDNLQFNLKGRFFDGFDKKSPFYLLNDEDYLQAAFTTFF